MTHRQLLDWYRLEREGWPSRDSETDEIEQFIKGDQWSYDGLHVLNNGNTLTVFEKGGGGAVLWHGVIDLVEHELFTEAVSGMWIHHDQRGIERRRWAKWFLQEFPAELET